MADISSAVPTDDQDVEIRIVLDTLAPPTGVAHMVRDRPEVYGPNGDDGGGVAFVGWLGLLRALSDLLPRDDATDR